MVAASRFAPGGECQRALSSRRNLHGAALACLVATANAPSSRRLARWPFRRSLPERRGSRCTGTTSAQNAIRLSIDSACGRCCSSPIAAHKGESGSL